MNKPATLLLVALVLSLVPHAQADGDGPGNVGTPECREVQLAAQAAVVNGMPYTNHGQMVRTAARVTSLAEEAGEITEECASCIVRQFARRILRPAFFPCEVPIEQVGRRQCDQEEQGRDDHAPQRTANGRLCRNRRHRPSRRDCVCRPPRSRRQAHQARPMPRNDAA